MWAEAGCFGWLKGLCVHSFRINVCLCTIERSDESKRYLFECGFTQIAEFSRIFQQQTRELKVDKKKRKQEQVENNLVELMKSCCNESLYYEPYRHHDPSQNKYVQCEKHPDIIIIIIVG